LYQPTTILAIGGLFYVILTWWFISSLVRGRVPAVRFGSTLYARLDETPALFWTFVAVDGAVLALMGWRLVTAGLAILHAG
jgi:hypothetical protein